MYWVFIVAFAGVGLWWVKVRRSRKAGSMR